MDAVKFLLEFDRMCRSCQGCAGCPAIGVCDCSRDSKEELKQLVGIVEKWSKDHSQKKNKIAGLSGEIPERSNEN